MITIMNTPSGLLAIFSVKHDPVVEEVDLCEYMIIAFHINITLLING